jgi:UDP-N-acetylmuramoyl-tripeptide--D-alanyl-D-alanine ligase
LASVIPENRARFTRDELLLATSGSCGPFEGAVTGVSTDSRAELEGALFVALKGEHFDGHHFVASAVGRGARVVVVEDTVDAGSAVVLRVPSTLRALGELAAFHRARWLGRVAAVAGSVGKTTTRTAAAVLLEAADPNVLCPKGNLNNLVGVPMVLLGLSEQHHFGVVELGTSVPGEIERLTRIARPDVGILTRIALEHSEALGDLDSIEREESALLSGLHPGAIAIANADDARCLAQLEAAPAGRRWSYGQSEASDYRIRRVDPISARSTRLCIERPAGGAIEVNSPLLGLPGAYALAAGLAATEGLLARPLRLEEVERALESPALGEPGRLTPLELPDGSLVLDDTYNSSPASVLSSVSVARELAERRGGRLMLVLGEMRELGSLSRAAHRDVGDGIAAAAAELVVAFGGDAILMLEASERLGRATQFAADALAALDIVAASRQPGDVILVKASRSLRAERIVQGLSPGALRHPAAGTNRTRGKLA